MVFADCDKPVARALKRFWFWCVASMLSGLSAHDIQLFLLYLISYIYICLDLYSGLPAHASSCFFALSSVLVHCRAASGVSAHGVETC